MRNFGYLENAVELAEYIFGSQKVPYIPYQEDGDWTAFLPKYEPQAEDFETNGCTVWGMQNQIETFYKAVYGIEPNYSERFNYLLTPVDPARGADPQRTYECGRKDGFIDHRLLPVTDTLAEFLDTSDLTKSLLAKGQNWLVEHDFLHEWLWTTQPANHLEILKDALKTCPIGASVTAWYERDGKYIDNGKRNNHWVIIYKVDSKGIHVFDSYDHSKKILSLDHYISRTKRIWVNRKTKSSSRRHVRLLERILKTLQLMKPSFLDVCRQHLNTDVTPQDKVSDEVACAEVVTTLLRKHYPETPIIAGTYTLWEYLKNPKNGFVEILEPEEGCIVISPTGTGTGVGHTGILFEDGLIASNNSFGINRGKFTINYTVGTWRKKYTEKQKMVTAFFKRVV